MYIYSTLNHETFKYQNPELAHEYNRQMFNKISRKNTSVTLHTLLVMFSRHCVKSKVFPHLRFWIALAVLWCHMLIVCVVLLQVKHIYSHISNGHYIGHFLSFSNRCPSSLFSAQVMAFTAIRWQDCYRLIHLFVEMRQKYKLAQKFWSMLDFRLNSVIITESQNLGGTV